MTLRILKPLAVALLLVPTGVSPPADVRPVRATVALVAELPDHARALLIVRAGTGDGVILLPQAEATVTDLAAAIALLDRTRHNEVAPLARDRQVILKTASIARPLTDRVRQHLTDQLTRLRRAPPRMVDGVGTVRAIEIRLPGTRSTLR